jgi:hypothetical protein
MTNSKRHVSFYERNMTNLKRHVTNQKRYQPFWARKVGFLHKFRGKIDTYKDCWFLLRGKIKSIHKDL